MISRMCRDGPSRKKTQGHSEMYDMSTVAQTHTGATPLTGPVWFLLV